MSRVNVKLKIAIDPQLSLIFLKHYRYLPILRRQLTSVGFTLTESLAIVVIIGIFAALSGPSFLNWLNQKRVDDALARIEGAIKETQAEAIKRSKDCTVTITQGVNQTITGSCLVTGDRQIADVTIDHNANNNPWTITFDFKGRNRLPSDDPGTLWLTIPDSAVKPKCLTLSVGIGLMRTGNYDPLASIKCQAP